MATFATPINTARKLRFSSLHDLSSPAPSPYTPFSGRRSGTIPPGTPALAPPTYNPTDIDDTLRTSFLDLLTAANTSADPAAPLLSETLTTLDTKLSECIALLETPSLHPPTRRAARQKFDTLLAELSTWRLVHTVWRAPEIRPRDLVTRRLDPQPMDPVAFDSQPSYVKTQRVVEWLENCANDALQRAGGPQVKPLDDPAYRWDYSASVYSESLSIDHVNKGGRLEEVERRAESRLSREVFRLVRAGRLEDAEDICRNAGQPWRAAAIAGGKNGSTMASNGVVGGARKMWRTAAAAIARGGGEMSPHERAVYGVFSGVLEPVLAVATTFEDQAWARLSVLLDGAAQRALEGEDINIDDDQVLQAWRECEFVGEGEGMGGEVWEGVRMARAYLGLGPDINSNHLSELLEVLARLGAARDEWVCRFAAHVALFLKMGGVLQNIMERERDRECFDATLQSYVVLVIDADLAAEAKAAEQGAILQPRSVVSELAAKYLSEMTSQERIVETYGKLLCAALRADLAHEKAEWKRIGVNHREVNDRWSMTLQKAGQCFLRETVDALIVSATDRIWESTLPESTVQPEGDMELEPEVSVVEQVTDEDELAFRAIEFLLYPPFANYVEALRRVTKAARRFFLCGKRTVARNLIAWFPSDVVSQVSPSSCPGAAHELECWRVYMEAVKLHNDWNVFQASQRPAPIPDKIRQEALAKPGEVSYQVQAAAALRLEGYNKEYEEFVRACDTKRDAAIERLKAALLFPGGWMQDKSGSGSMDDDDQQRATEIRAVRRQCIPQIAVLLHNVLHESGMYSIAISLAQTVADESHRLYEEFGAEELSAFLTRIADSSVHYADESVRGGMKRPYRGTFFEEIPAEE